jgi:hypothetical protein
MRGSTDVNAVAPHVAVNQARRKERERQKRRFLGSRRAGFFDLRNLLTSGRNLLNKRHLSCSHPEKPAMCEKCAEIDEKIARYKLLAQRTTDELTRSGITLLIERYEMQKRELHPEQQE